MKNKIYVALVHYPVFNKHNQVVTTSITNLDIHDISRSCKTFNVPQYYIITNLESQRKFLDRILKFWDSDIAQKYNPDRAIALAMISAKDSIEKTVKEIENQEGIRPVIISTTATKYEAAISFENCRSITKPILLLFGTGNGLAKEVHEYADFTLEPIEGSSGYNHLSVRSAVAIVLDRLSSEK